MTKAYFSSIPYLTEASGRQIGDVVRSSTGSPGGEFLQENGQVVSLAASPNLVARTKSWTWGYTGQDNANASAETYPLIVGSTYYFLDQATNLQKRLTAGSAHSLVASRVAPADSFFGSNYTSYTPVGLFEANGTLFQIWREHNHDEPEPGISADTYSARIYASTDSGSTWTLILNGVEGNPDGFIAGANGVAYVGSKYVLCSAQVADRVYTSSAALSGWSGITISSVGAFWGRGSPPKVVSGTLYLFGSSNTDVATSINGIAWTTSTPVGIPTSSIMYHTASSKWYGMTAGQIKSTTVATSAWNSEMADPGSGVRGNSFLLLNNCGPIIVMASGNGNLITLIWSTGNGTWETEFVLFASTAFVPHNNTRWIFFYDNRIHISGPSGRTRQLVTDYISNVNLLTTPNTAKGAVSYIKVR